MKEHEIVDLVQELDEVHFREFWWDSQLLARAAQARDPRVVEVLLVRHHCLQNKKADSAHVVRNTIKQMEGPDFLTLWRLVDSLNDHRLIVESIDDPYSRPWAAAFVLGEIGGKPAMSKITGKLAPFNVNRHYMMIRILVHLIARYIQIGQEREPMVEGIDVKTGQRFRSPAKEMDPDTYERVLKRRRQANEYFTAVDPLMIQYIRRHVSQMHDSIIPVSKAALFDGLRRIPVS